MKKLLFTLALLITSAAFVACDDDDDKKIAVSDLPAAAQTFLKTHFPNQEARLVEKDNDGYDVVLANGFKVDFALSGEWDDVDGLGQQVPASILELIPDAIPLYIGEYYQQNFVTEVNKEPYGYEIELNNTWEIEFDASGKFLREDRH